MNLERAMKTPGCINEAEASYLAKLASSRQSIVEIGSWLGRSAVAMAQNTSGLVYCVDTWAGELRYKLDMNSSAYMAFLANTEGILNILPIALPSERAAKVFLRSGMKFDMVFIDGAHDFENVKLDIALWSQLLAPGGVLCGHNYQDEEGVRKAVTLLIPKFKLVDNTYIWTLEEQ